MDKNHIIEIITKDAQEVSKLTENFMKYSAIPPIYLDLTLSKVKNLYAELLLLKKEDANELSMEDVAEALLDKKTSETSPTEAPEKKKKSKPDFNKKIASGLTDNQAQAQKQSKESLEELNRKREEHFLATQLKYDPVKDIKKSISLNEKIWFIKELFDGDIETYNHTLEELNHFEYLEQALDFLDARFSWDYTNQTVRDFFEYIYRRFI